MIKFNDYILRSHTAVSSKEKTIEAANCGETVLFVGKRGVGKEIFMNFYINQRTEITDGKEEWVTINCAQPSSSLTLELFGADKGAYTGAIKDVIGLVEQGKNIAFDEIGDMPEENQSGILRLLQNKEFSRIGSTKVEKFKDFKFIAATNKISSLRGDLVDRFEVIVKIFPLKFRKLDIKYFLIEYLKQNGIDYLSSTLWDILINELEYKGNIREFLRILEEITPATHFKLKSKSIDPNKYKISTLPLDISETPTVLTANSYFSKHYNLSNDDWLYLNEDEIIKLDDLINNKIVEYGDIFLQLLEKELLSQHESEIYQATSLFEEQAPPNVSEVLENIANSINKSSIINNQAIPKIPFEINDIFKLDIKRGKRIFELRWFNHLLSEKYTRKEIMNKLKISSDTYTRLKRDLKNNSHQIN
ncbi:MAG: sigma 54-interacting transcriptional regulator [Pseudomonadota bacterium]